MRETGFEGDESGRAPEASVGPFSYAPSSDAWPSFAAAVRRLVAEPGVRSVCEVGASSDPLLDVDEVERYGLQYTVLDISTEELAKVPPSFSTVAADITAPDLRLGRSYDVLLSRMVAEHVSDAEAFHRNVRALLVPGGRAAHLFPTLYSLPFVANRLLPTRMSAALLDVFQDERRDRVEGKWPAYYHWCRGPSARQVARFRRLGYRVERYTGYFGTDYYRRMPLLHRADQRLTAILVDHPVAALTSYAEVLLRRV